MKDVVRDKLTREAFAARELIEALSSDDADLNHDMVEGETGLFEAIDCALGEMRECNIMLDGIVSIVRGLEARKSRIDKRRVRLRGLIEQALAVAEIKSHVFPDATLTIKSTPQKTIITDEAAIPAKFWVPQPHKLDRKALLEALKAEKITGAELSNGSTTLQIRKN